VSQNPDHHADIAIPDRHTGLIPRALGVQVDTPDRFLCSITPSSTRVCATPKDQPYYPSHQRPELDHSNRTARRYRDGWGRPNHDPLAGPYLGLCGVWLQGPLPSLVEDAFDLPGMPFPFRPFGRVLDWRHRSQLGYEWIHLPTGSSRAASAFPARSDMAYGAVPVSSVGLSRPHHPRSSHTYLVDRDRGRRRPPSATMRNWRPDLYICGLTEMLNTLPPWRQESVGHLFICSRIFIMAT
jgi:hypothetical protein